MKSIIMVGLTGILTFTGLGVGLIQDKNQSTTPEKVSVKSVSDLPEGVVKEYKVEKGDTFAEVMLAQGVSYNDINAILDSAKNVFDFTTVGAGKVLKFVFVNKAFAAMEYPLNSDTVVHVKKEGDGFKVAEEDIQYDITQVTAQGTITDSLFMSAKDAGVDDKVILKMAEAFSWDIDFATDIQSGDSFKVVYEKRSFDGKPAGAGKLLAAEFTNKGKTQTLYRYEDAFYDESGKSVMRQFLRSPLSYSYISSGYEGSRVNPVTRKVEAHFAIDYAAPLGTPIVASAKGTVSYATSKGGLGITVEIKHGGSYLTQYAHMSRIAKGIKNGVEVNQGDIIGYVGSTGVSSGPHLQYAMYKGNTKVNPLNEESSREISIEEKDRADFEGTTNKLKLVLGAKN